MMMAKRILIADDEPDTLFFLTTILSKKGYEVIACKNAFEVAIRIAEQPDLVLLDINMPGKKGTEVCKEIKNNSLTSSIPIILISGNDDVAAECRNCSANTFLQKPITIPALLNMVKAYT